MSWVWIVFPVYKDNWFVNWILNIYNRGSENRFNASPICGRWVFSALWLQLRATDKVSPWVRKDCCRRNNTCLCLTTDRKRSQNIYFLWLDKSQVALISVIEVYLKIILGVPSHYLSPLYRSVCSHTAFRKKWT